MNKASQPSSGNDLIPGIAAALVFLALLLLLGTPLFWLSAFLAIGVYFGAKWSLPPPKPPQAVVETPAMLLAELRTLLAPFATGNLQLPASAFLKRGEAIVKILHEEATIGPEIAALVRQYLELARDALRRYRDSKRPGVRSAGQAEQALRDMLDDISGRFKRLSTAVESRNDAELATEMRALRRTLDDLDALYMHLGENNQ